MARLALYTPTRADCDLLIEVMRVVFLAAVDGAGDETQPQTAADVTLW